MYVLSSKRANKKLYFRLSLIHMGLDLCYAWTTQYLKVSGRDYWSVVLFVYIYNTLPSSMALHLRVAEIEMITVVLGRRGIFYNAA